MSPLEPYWEKVLRLAEPQNLMKFTLTYDGDLPSSGNSNKTAYVSRIRNVFHDQMADLWDTNVILRQLARTARVLKNTQNGPKWHTQRPELPDYLEPIHPVGDAMIDLCAPLAVGGNGYIPLVRKSLYLTCEIEILFLRHEDPGALVLQGGDLDGRIKTLFDALRMPNEQEASKGEAPTADPLYCLLESDTLISDLSIKTGRLLGERTKKPHAVRLWINVAVKVLRVSDQNQCLMGDG